MSHALRFSSGAYSSVKTLRSQTRRKTAQTNVRLELSQRKLVCHWRWKAPGCARGVGGIAKGTMWAVLLWLKLIGFPWCPLLATCGAVTLNALIYDRRIKPSTEKATSLKKPYWQSPVTSCALSQFQLNWGRTGLQGWAAWVWHEEWPQKVVGHLVTLKRYEFHSRILIQVASANITSAIMLAELIFLFLFFLFIFVDVRYHSEVWDQFLRFFF